jgi:hypothetical protein
MAERDVITKEKIEFTGLVNFKGYYGFAHNWLKDELYGVDEMRYVEKVSGSERSIDIDWKAVKPLTDYFKIELTIRWEVRNLTDVEVEIDGKKEKMNKGKVSIEIKTALVRDPESKMDRSGALKIMRDIYSKYIIPGRIEDMRIKTQQETIRFKEELKSYLDISARR